MKTDVKKLRVLILEDRPLDAELLKLALEDAGYVLDLKRVDSEAAFKAALDEVPDIILSDYKLPGFDGIKALSILRESKRDIPFILVSGTIGEERAVEAMRQGASDYLLKDRLGRLGTAVAAAIEQKRLRTEAYLASEELRESQLRLGAFLDNSPALTYTKDIAGRYLHVNRQFERSFGLRPGQVVGKRDADLFSPAQAAKFRDSDRAVLLRGAALESEETVNFADGAHTISVVRFPLYDAYGAADGVGAIATDISDRKREDDLYRATFNQTGAGIMHTSPDGRFLRVNQKFCDLLGYSHEEILARSFADITHPEDLEKSDALRVQLLAGANGNGLPQIEKRYIRKDGTVIWAAVSASLVSKPNGEPDYFVAMMLDISDRKAAEQKYRASFEQAAVGIALTGLDRRYLAVNQKFCDMMGYSREELLQMHSGQLSHPDYALEDRTNMQRFLSGEIETFNGEKRFVRKDGSVLWVKRSVSLVRDAAGKAQYFIRVAEDITERKAQADKIARLNRIHSVMSGINSLIVRARDRQALLDGACKIAVEHGRFGLAWIGMLDAGSQTVNPVAWVGEDAETFVSTPVPMLIEGVRTNGAIACAIDEKRTIYTNDIAAEPNVGRTRRAEAIRRGYRSRIVLPLIVQDAAVGHISLYAKEPNFFNDEELRLLNSLAGDISYALEFIGKDEKIEYLAYHDSLTGLPNRVLFRDRLQQMVAQAERDKRSAAVLMVDLDRFKNVNDTLGHAVGDRLLKCAAERLSQCVRRGDSVARMSGDEFAIVLSDLAAADDAGLVVQKIMKQFAAPFDLNGNEAFVTASIGISVFPADSRDVDALIKGAHTAMYGAKEHGRNTFRYYTAEMNALVSKRLQLETRLRRAVERQEFALHYQPKVRATSGEVVGLEALLRWQPPDGDGAPPAEFIPILEETGLIVQVGEWVVDAACAQISAWRRAGIQPLPVAINISGRQFRQAGLDKTIAQKLAQFGIGPRWLEIEITESSLMENPDEAVAMLNNLKALGITISVDDFGTGYSSLSYLKRFPLDTLKIDRSFVRDIMVNADDAAIARAIVSMAHSLNLKVVAEGVETVEQLGFLRANRCDQIQGYLFSKPLAADACSALLASARRLGPPAEIGDVEDVPALLLVDDDRDSLELLRCMLEKDGYRILTASSADDALALLARHRVGVVVSDQDMPGLSGVEFFKRSKLMYPEVARIMLTGYDDYTLAATAINEAGVCKLFLKDRDDHLLSSEIRKAFWRQDPDVGPHSARDLLTTVLT